MSLSARSWERAHSTGTILVLVGCVVAVVCAATVAVGNGSVVLVGGSLCAAVTLGIVNWRRSISALLVFIPLSGVVAVVLYPETQIAALLKDILFVIPAYLGFGLMILRRRIPIAIPGPVPLLLIFSAIVFVEAFNPSGLGALASLIGIKVWLLYLPLYWLGYHLVRSETELDRLLALLVAVGIVPALAGVIEALLFVGGRAEVVYAFYGPAAASVSQNFAQFPVGGLMVRRVPSTFTFVTQYYFFCSAAIAFAYAGLRRAKSRSLRAGYSAGMALFITAAITSGQRSAYIFVPILLGLIVALDGRRSIAVATFLGALVATIVLVIPGGLETTASAGDSALSTGVSELSSTVVGGFDQSLSVFVAGHGTGYDTGAGRFAMVQVAGVEGWFAKAAIELGILGLAAVTALVCRLGVFLFAVHARTRGTSLRPLSAALVALLLWNILYSLKGQQIDIDPMNVYFWLFAGVIASLPRLQVLRTDT